MRRFPQNAVASSARSHLLIQLGRYSEAETLLAPSVSRLSTSDDWVAAHILAMADIKRGRTQEAISRLEHGANSCAFHKQRLYFETALSFALLKDKRPGEAHDKLAELSETFGTDRRQTTNITLLRIHALAEIGDTGKAKDLIENAEIIDFAAARQKKLASALTERYALSSHSAPAKERSLALEQDISDLELELVLPVQSKVKRLVA